MSRFFFPTVPNQGQDRDGICRSWGQHHYETFDGIYFYVPGTCSYILAQDCHSATPQYTVWVRSNLDTETHKVYGVCCSILLLNYFLAFSELGQLVSIYHQGATENIYLIL